MMANRRGRWADWLKEVQSLALPVRLVLGTVLLLALGGVAWLGMRQAGRQRVWLFETERFSAQELAAMRAAFASAGLSDFAVKSGRIEVPRDESARYLAALAQRRDLPYRFFEEVLRGRHWFTPQGDLDRQWDLAAQQFLAGIIREMDGVDQAWVIWDAAPKRGLRPRDDVRALVGVKMLPGYTLSPPISGAIHDLVVGSRAGLTPENVTVVDLDLSEPSAQAATGRHSRVDPLARVAQLEQHYAEKLEKLLAFIEGVVVSVDVTLHSRAGVEREAASSSGVELTARSDTVSVAADGSDAHAAAPAGADYAPRAASQGPVMLHEPPTAPAAAEAPRPDVERPDPLPARLAVTIGVPDEYFSLRAQAVGMATGAGLEAEDDRIRRLVVAALPSLREPVSVAVHRYRRRPAAAESGVAAWVDFGGLGGVQVAAAIVLLSAALVILVVRSAIVSARLRRMAAHAARIPPSAGPHDAQLRGQAHSMVHRDAARTARVLQSWIHPGNDP